MTFTTDIFAPLMNSSDLFRSYLVETFVGCLKQSVSEMYCVRYFSLSAMRFAQILLGFGLMALVSSQVERRSSDDASGKRQVPCVE